MAMVKIDDLCHQFGGSSHGTELQDSEAIAFSLSLSRTSGPLHPWAHVTSGIALRAPFPVTLAGVHTGVILVRHLTLPWHLFRPRHQPRSLAATPLVFLERLRHRDLHRRWPPRTHRQSPQKLEDLLDDQAQIMALLPARLAREHETALAVATPTPTRAPARPHPRVGAVANPIGTSGIGRAAGARKSWKPVVSIVG